MVFSMIPTLMTEDAVDEHHDCRNDNEYQHTGGKCCPSKSDGFNCGCKDKEFSDFKDHKNCGDN